MLQGEFIFENAPFRECHASTLVEVPSGDLLAAWFAGSKEGNPDVGIWISRLEGGAWSEPCLAADEEGVPCWNPVLFMGPDRVLWLFYKVGESPRSWSGAYLRSRDQGRSWSGPMLQPAGLLGPIKNKPIILSNGKMACPTSVESYRAWTSWVEILDPDGTAWARHGPIAYPGVNLGLIQPTLVELGKGRLRAFMRATRTIGRVCVADSVDLGITWGPARKTVLPNPNSGIDAVGLRSGSVAMIYNHTAEARTPLNAAISLDGGERWRAPRTLEDEPGEYSYPAVIEGSDGMIHATYTYRRETIRHVAFSEDWLLGRSQ
jgi:predicted neuraminidase